MEEKESKVNYFVYALVFVAILIVATVAITYAYFKVNTDFDTNLGGASATLECIDMTLSDNNTTLGLSHNYPITDTLAMQSGSVTPLEVTVTNNCSNDVKYSLALSTLALASNQSNYIEDGKIRYKIVKNDADHKGIDYLDSMTKIATTSQLYSDLTGPDGELATKYENYVLKQIYSVDDLVTLGVNTSNTYDIYMWVDYYEGDAQMYESNDAVHNESFDGTTEGKKFAAALSLSFNTGESNELVPNPIGAYLINLDNQSDIGLQQEIIEGDDLYRFSGIQGNAGINNYICLGTTSKCASGTDNMYRIIGVNPTNGEIKVIKETPWNNGTTYSWHNVDEDITWLTSDLYTGTVKEIYNTLSFKNMIVTNHSWNVGTTNSLSIAARESVIDYEKSTTGTANIGIMSLTDYYLAYNGDRNWYSDYDKTTNWIGGYLNGNTTNHEWTMTYYGNTNNYYGAWDVLYDIGHSGVPGIAGVTVLVIRPVFYLKSSVDFIGGTGTSTDPFIVY